VIVGAGFGGLSAAQALAKAPVEVTVIDRRNYHLFQPLLYQVATAGLSPAEIAWPIRGILRNQSNAVVQLGRITAVDKDRREVIVGDRRLGYDYLVLATGARHAYFDHPEWEGVAPGLKKIADATQIRERILLAFERAEMEDCDEDERRRLLTFVIVGGGPTGVEMAGAIAELARRALAADFRFIDPGTTRIVLVEAGPRLLSTFPESLSENARLALERLGVEVCLGVAVTHCDDAGVRIGDRAIGARNIIWAAGVMASPAASWLEAAHDKAGRVKVAADFSVPGFPEVFVVGDTASLVDAGGRPLPGLAPAAKQAGQHVAAQIAARVTGKPAPAPFRYGDYGNLATVGRKAAVADFGRLRLTGFPAWLLWSVAHIYFLISLRSRFAVALNWLWNYVTFQRGARLITGTEGDDSGAQSAAAVLPDP
jgi:NADH dehydrogenase